MNRRDEIARNIALWREKLPGVTVCAVTKTMPVEDINAAVACGIAEIGENRVQELTEKLDRIEGAPRINLIGRLQTNKVKYLIGRVDLIQSVDRIELVEEIARRSRNAGTVTDALIQVSVAGEEQKGGVAPNGLDALLRACEETQGIRVRGLMSVMPLTDDTALLRGYFRQMRRLFEELASENNEKISMDILSMGMSGDCLIAGEEGATMVRIGRGIFGARN